MDLVERLRQGVGHIPADITNAVRRENMAGEAMTQCPPDHPLMKAWMAYQNGEDYQNSYKWATAAIEQLVHGSMWAAFMAGFAAAGGKTTVERNDMRDLDVPASEVNHGDL